MAPAVRCDLTLVRVVGRVVRPTRAARAARLSITMVDADSRLGD